MTKSRIRLLWALSSWDLKSSRDVDWIASHSNAWLSMEWGKIPSLSPVRTFPVLIYVHKLIMYFTCFLRKVPMSYLWVIFTNQMRTLVWLDKQRHFYVLFKAETLATPYQLNRLALHRRTENSVRGKQEIATENSQNSPQEQHFNCFIEVTIKIWVLLILKIIPKYSQKWIS